MGRKDAGLLRPPPVPVQGAASRVAWLLRCCQRSAELGILGFAGKENGNPSPSGVYSLV